MPYAEVDFPSQQQFIDLLHELQQVLVAQSRPLQAEVDI